MEGSASDFEIGVPDSCGILLLGGDVEHVEAVLGVAVDVLGVEASLGSVKLHDSRVVVRNLVLLVLEDEADVEGVTGTPDASFPVYEGFQSLVENLASHIEAAEGLLVSGRHLEVARGASTLGDHHEGFPGQGDLCHSVSPGLGITYLLELVAIDVELGIEDRLGGDDVADADPDLVAAGIFGYDSEVGGDEIDGGELLLVHVVGGLQRVVPVFPLIFIPIVE